VIFIPIGQLNQYKKDKVLVCYCCYFSYIVAESRHFATDLSFNELLIKYHMKCYSKLPTSVIYSCV